MSDPIRPIPESGLGDVLARHLADNSLWRIRWGREGLTRMVPAPSEENTPHWFGPALTDLQVNGYGGVDFQRPCGRDELMHAAETLQRDGCGRALITLITCEWDHLLAKIRDLRKIVRNDPFLSRVFCGWHIEGPFLSEKPGFRGAHASQWMRDPGVDDVDALRSVSGDDPILLTLAPERDPTMRFVRAAVRAGFCVSFGHSDASASLLRAGVAAGATGYTHLGNGCPTLLDRHDNIIWRVCDSPDLVVGLIPDTIHVSPELFRLLHRALGNDRVYWTTDAMAAAGASNGTFTIGDKEVLVGADRVVRDPSSAGFAGSALEPIRAIQTGSQMLRQPAHAVWDFFSTNPSRFMGLPTALRPGDAVCVFEES